MKYHQVNEPPSSTPGSRQEHSLQWSFLLDFSLFVFLAGQGGEDNSSNWVFPGGSGPMQKTQVQSLGQEDPLEKEMAKRSLFLPEKSHGQGSLQVHGLQVHGVTKG